MAPNPEKTNFKDTKDKKFSRIYPESEGDHVVISGMAGRFPNSRNTAEYEHNLFNKIDMVDDEETRWKHFNVEIPKRCGKVYDLEKFDATFFGVHFKQAHTMDPQCRMLIESAYEAVLDAGINPKDIRGSRTGVFIGACISESEKTWFYEKISSGGFGITGCSRAMLANRVSYTLGLNGPSYLVDTACSSSLYALDTAFTAFRNGEIDAAIIGGANLCLHPYVTLQFARLGVLAADGYCRPFDKDATGYTRSEAVNCMFLQRKRDAKRIYASVIYSKTNCDGYKPEGITYPAGLIQERLLREFYNNVDIRPKDLGYIEAHSTGTIVGDPEECRAIDNVLCKERDEPLLVGSVKSNVGHSEAASGICSLVKVVLAFERGCIPPNINFTAIRPGIPALEEGRLKVVSDVEKLEKPYIGVNSFGFGGANAHTLLRANDKEKINFGIPSDNLPRLINWSGRTEEAINVVFNSVESRPLDGEYCSLLHNIQRENIPGFVFRGYALYAQGDEPNAKCLLKDVQHYTGISRPIVWLFSGMGSQWTEMGASLMDIPIFKASIEKCHKILAPKGLNLINILTSNDPTIFDNILHSFVGIAAVQIGIVDVLRALNLKPDFIIGHSVGELACGYADEAFTAEQMILAAYSRGKVSVDIEKIKGSMAAVGLGYKKIVTMLPSTIEAACHNGPDSTTISGPAEDVTKFVAELKAKKIFAKEVPCSNIAYHSRYIAHMGPLLLKYLKEIIPEPKRRSPKWLSTSVPRNQWDQPACQFSSAEYHTNNLLNSVLFEETSAHLPHNALTIEIAPHGLLQAIIKKAMPNAVHIPLTQRGNKNNVQFFLQGLGKLYLNGLDFPLERLYPAVQWPVSRGTPNISPLIKWDHSEDWFVTKFENIKSMASGERSFRVGLASDDDEYLSGHIIDGKVLIPAAGYLQYVWETLSLMKTGPVFMDMAVEFDDVRFLRATPLPKDGYLDLVVMIHYGTGNFEITEAGALIVTGTIREITNPQPPILPKLKESTTKQPIVQTKDFYKELRLRGYHYAGEFKTVLEASIDGLWGKVQWNYNWVTFIDNMFQINLLGTDSRSLMLPTRIRKLRIFGKHHLTLLNDLPTDKQELDVYSVPELNKIVSGGIEVYGLHASVVPRRKAPGIPVLEKYQFIPHFPAPKLSISDAVRTCVQLALENCPTLKVKIVEVDLDKTEPIIVHFLDALEDLPVVTGDYMFLSEQDIDLGPIHVEDGKLSTQSNCMFVISKNCLNRSDFVDIAQKSLMDTGFLLSREPAGLSMSQIAAPPSFNIVAVLPVDGETLVLLQGAKKKFVGISTVIKVSEADTQFAWITKVQTELTKGPVILVAQNEKYNGLLGLVNCLRKEPDGNLITCVFINDPKAPPFDIALPFYENQLKLGFGVNVYKNGKWGTYRHLQLVQEVQCKPQTGHVYGNMTQRGDLSSLKWFEGNADIKKCNTRVVYSALNFRDVMLASGRLSSDIYGVGRQDQQCVFGFEFCGTSTEDGRGIMGMIGKGAVSSYTNCDPRIVWDAPKGWTLMESATVPVVYITVYYAFFWAADIRKGKTILIHSGTGGIGLSAIRVALGYGLEVYTTVGTPEKRKYLLDNFPQIKESHIGNSRDTSFEAMIMEQTEGKGVDFVLNSLAEDKLHASIRCLGRGGHFLEIGKFDLSNDSKIGLGSFLKELSFHSILADNLLTAADDIIYNLKSMIDNDVVRGIVKPLPVTVFPASDLESAFRFMTTGKHIGKVLLQVRDDPTSNSTIPMKVIPQVYFDPKLVYIIPGGLGGFGLELADWMTLRGAKKLVLSSSRGITKQYQTYRIYLWESYGTKVVINTDDITTLSGCESLIKAGLRLGPIGGIFNLAVVLRDSIFTNQTPEKFAECMAPKACATKYLDQLSRKMCPQLQHFVIFSSVSCGRGNAGQTNYGMANSIMERIVEQRVTDGLPGKAIQWGAVGEVGLVADMAEDKIDMEIGGTLQQRISSCLQELDPLLTSPDPIVSSMVVAEKRTSRGGKENIIETVMNIMSIRDLKSVSMGTTLSEMGMDSLMAVEIKQTLERDFELILTPQDLRSLTFQKLHELSDVRDKESRDTVKMKLASSDKPKGIVLLLRNIGDQNTTDKVIFPLITKNAVATGINKTIIIPGLEGCAGTVWNNLGRNLNSSTVVLQLKHTSHLTTIPEVANAVFNDVIQNLKKSENFYLIGYSYGSLIALELAYLLEQAGYHGQILVVDGGPYFLKKLCLGHLGENFRDDDIWNLLFTLICHQIFPDEPAENISAIFEQLNSLDERLDKFLELVEKQDMYTKEYAELTIKAFFTRCKMAATLDLSTVKSIESPITLVRPSEVALTDIAEDYELSKITKNKISIKYVEGDHTTMLENPSLAQIINDTDPALQEDKSFESYIRKK